MKRVTKKEFYLNLLSPREYDLNKSSSGCTPCLEEAKKIIRKVEGRTLNEIKIEEIKKIVKSIFESSKRGNQQI